MKNSLTLVVQNGHAKSRDILDYEFTRNNESIFGSSISWLLLEAVRKYSCSWVSHK